MDFKAKFNLRQKRKKTEIHASFRIILNFWKTPSYVWTSDFFFFVTK